MSRSRYISILALVLATLVVPSAAQASPDDVVADCSDGSLDGSYSRGDLQGALDQLGGGDFVYGNCENLIGGALTAPGRDNRGDGNGDGTGAGAGGAGSPGGPGAAGELTGVEAVGGTGAGLEEDASTLGKDARDLELSDLAGAGKPTLSVGGRTIEPGGDGLLRVAQAANGLPLPMLLSIIAIGALMLVTSLIALRRRVPALARLPLLSRLPAPSPPSLRRGSPRWSRR